MRVVVGCLRTFHDWKNYSGQCGLKGKWEESWEGHLGDELNEEFLHLCLDSMY